MATQEIIINTTATDKFILLKNNRVAISTVKKLIPQLKQLKRIFDTEIKLYKLFKTFLVSGPTIPSITNGE